MLGWNGDDSRLITAGSDKVIRVWNWKSGEMLRKMEGHSYDVFVIKTHPVHSDLMFTAGHDGLLVVSPKFIHLFKVVFRFGTYRLERHFGSIRISWTCTLVPTRFSTWLLHRKAIDLHTLT
jgi:WD40 repeat protein